MFWLFSAASRSSEFFYAGIVKRIRCQQYHPQFLCFQSCTSVPLVTELLRALDQLSDTPHSWLKARDVEHVICHYHSHMGAERGVWPPQEQIPEKICEQIVDVRIPQDVGQVLEVPKTACRDRSLECTAEQILDVPVPEMVKQLVEAPKTILQDRIQQRTVEHIAADTPVPQDVEEPAEFFKAFSQDRVQLRFGGQIIENPAVTRQSDGRKDATGCEHVRSTRRQRSRSGETYHPGKDQPGYQARRDPTVADR